MRALTLLELDFVVGGQNQAPTCTTVAVTDGGRVVGHVTVCECPANTQMKTTVDQGGATVTCEPASPPSGPHPQP